MVGFFDVSCVKCKRKFGWSGKFEDRPPCPRCGHTIPKEEMDEDLRKMQEFRELLAKRPSDAKGQELKKQRIAAGLTLGQAAKELEIGAAQLSGWERDSSTLPEDVANRMAEAYGLDV